MFDSAISQTTVCRFEGLTLSYNNMFKVYTLLSAWLHRIERQGSLPPSAGENSSPNPRTKRKRRTTIDFTIKGVKV